MAGESMARLSIIRLILGANGPRVPWMLRESQREAMLSAALR